jgi:hypothetical protein
VDETLAVATLLLGRALCADCIASKAGIDLDSVAPAIRSIERGLIVAVRRAGPCHQCGLDAMTFSIPLD